MALCKAAEGCSKEGKKLGFCGTHYAQVQRGARDPAGHLLRELRATYVGTGVLCRAPDCKRVPFARGLCNRHHQLFRFARIDANGLPTDPSTWKSFYNPNRKTAGTAGPCKLPTCRMQRVDSTTLLCGKHTRQVALGLIDVEGNVLREAYRVQRYTEADICRASGCTNKARSNFFCRSHVGAFTSGRLAADGTDLGVPASGRASRGNARHLNGDGYVLVSAPADHPRGDADGLVFEHRLVMEQQLGRHLTPQEIVHHKDGNRQNNAPANLELLTRKRHPTAHEYTVETALTALEALAINDPVAYQALLAKHQGGVS